MHHFDEMAKALAGGLSRRQALRKVGGSLAGALLASMGLGKAWGATAKNCADYCKNHVGISPGNGNAYGQCVSNCSNCLLGGGHPCGASGCCTGGDMCNQHMVCVSPCDPVGDFCSEDSDCCSGGCCRASDGSADSTCADLSSDPANCGACGNACRPGTVCASGMCYGGTCRGACPAGSFCIDSSGTCNSPFVNGSPLPDELTCTAAVGAYVCASGVCDADNACGYANGTACSSDDECRSTHCVSGFCMA
jgi:hypothetical protein